MQKSALIIIDLQAFIKKLAKDAVPYGWDKIIENNRALIFLTFCQHRRLQLSSLQIPSPPHLWLFLILHYS